MQCPPHHGASSRWCIQQGSPHGMRYLYISSGLPSPRAPQCLDIKKTLLFPNFLYIIDRENNSLLAMLGKE